MHVQVQSRGIVAKAEPSTDEGRSQVSASFELGTFTFAVLMTLLAVDMKRRRADELYTPL